MLQVGTLSHLNIHCVSKTNTSITVFAQFRAVFFQTISCFFFVPVFLDQFLLTESVEGTIFHWFLLWAWAGTDFVTSLWLLRASVYSSINLSSTRTFSQCFYSWDLSTILLPIPSRTVKLNHYSIRQLSNFPSQRKGDNNSFAQSSINGE